MTTIRISESATNGQSDTDRRRLIAVLNAFLGALETRGQSPATLRTRRDGLRRFSEFMERHGIERLQELTSGSLLSYAHELRARELSDNTISCYLRSTRQLLAWLVSRGELFENPAAGVPMPRRDKVVLRVPSREQVLRLLQQPDTETPLGIRNRALLEFFYGSGARLAEAVGVNVRDLDLVAGTVRIRGKGARERIIPLSRPARQWIERYLSGARSELLSLFSPHDALWISYRGNRLGREAVDCLPSKPVPPIADPQCIVRREQTQQFRPGAGQVALYPLPSRATERDDAFPGSLASDADRSSDQVQVPHIDPDRFCQSGPGTVEELQQRAIADTERRLRIGLLEETKNLFPAGNTQHDLVSARHGNSCCRVLEQLPTAHKPSQQLPGGAQVAGDGVVTQLPGTQLVGVAEE